MRCGSRSSDGVTSGGSASLPCCCQDITTFFGLTDDWARLYAALKATRAIGREKFSAAEWELSNDLISAAERALYRR
jgi:hypothetical protein